MEALLDEKSKKHGQGKVGHLGFSQNTSMFYPLENLQYLGQGQGRILVIPVCAKKKTVGKCV